MDNVAVSCRYHTRVQHGRDFGNSESLFHFGLVGSDSFWFMEQEDPSVVAGALSDPLDH